MAAWQCPYYIVSREEVLATFSEVPRKLPQGFVRSCKGWAEYEKAIEYLDARMSKNSREGRFYWGDTASTDLSAHLSDDKMNLESLSVRVDLNVSVSEQIDLLLGLVDILDGVLVEAFDDVTILPTIDALRWSIMRSDAAKFVTNPRKYFEDLKNNPIDDW